MKPILVTGGAGFIGSHTCVELLAAGHDIVVLDNLSNSDEAVIEHVRTLAGRNLTFIKASILSEALDELLAPHDIGSVIHFAALKAVEESVRNPLTYYETNVGGTISLLNWAARRGVDKFVFSSSATVYGFPETCPVDEGAATGPINPYGQTKLVCEQLLQAHAAANPGFKVAILRYFNPAGAHESALIGESPKGVPSNLFPYVGGILQGRYPFLRVFGDDYPTRDGSGVRDYIHVMDLAEAHRVALDALDKHPGFLINVGTGTGYSVLEVVQAFEAATGTQIPVERQARRAGDAAEVYAETSRSRQILEWAPKRGLAEMCVDAVRWYGKPEAHLTA